MTKKQYEKLYLQARSRWPTIQRQAARAILKAYTDATEKIGALLVSNVFAGNDAALIAAIDAQLNAALPIIQEAIETETFNAIHKGYADFATIEYRYILDAIKAAEAVTLFDGKVLREIYIQVDHELVAITASRVWQDGYTFSRRVWKAANQYQVDIKNIVLAGQAQGLPNETIARALNDFVKDGKLRVAKRYGKLVPGAANYMRRIGKNVDWRALRVTRSEFGASLQTAAVYNGERNFGGTGEYDWVLSSGHAHADICDTYAAGGPYRAAQVPSYPHPHCFCTPRVRLRNLNSVVADLRAWIKDPTSAPNVQAWYDNYYRPASYRI